MKVLVCIDDTDNLYSRGTGKLAAAIMEMVEERNWGRCFGITRHQLFVHPDVPYTSHNSSMCFEADIDKMFLSDLTAYIVDYLTAESAEGSDPGLCIVLPDQLGDPDLLIKFGLEAKKKVLKKEDAYRLADQMGIYLTEHGGTGQGVIGALAGTGLRLSGNDGRFRGKLIIESQTNLVSVREILSQTGVAHVRSLEGYELAPGELVRLGEKVKAVLLKGVKVLLVNPVSDAGPDGASWETYTKEQLKAF
ncbi:MAG TPA: hypothetical protein DCW46_06960 [Desulfotomaculum sp.]|nr:hypothetical protein [Desulfotomaculum sp.]